MVWQTNFLTDFCLKNILKVKKYSSVKMVSHQTKSKMVNKEKIKLQSELGLGRKRLCEFITLKGYGILQK